MRAFDARLYMTSTIQYIISHFGIDTLYQSKRLLGIFADLEPGKKNEFKKLELLINSNATVTLLNVRSKGQVEQVSTVKKLVFQLCSQYFIAENVAISACKSFWLGIGGSEHIFQIAFIPQDIKQQNKQAQISNDSSHPAAIPTNTTTNDSAHQNNTFPSPNKKRKIVIIAASFILLFGVIFFILLLSTCSTGGNLPSSDIITNNDSHESQDPAISKPSSGASRPDFSEILRRETSETIVKVYENDYDKNGTVEAFATTQSDFDGYHNLWYISSIGAVSVSGNGHIPQMITTDEGYILVPWRAGYGATICFGLYHGQVKTLEIYTFDIFQDKETGIIYSVREIYTAEGELHCNTVCRFDEDSFELILTDESYEIDACEAPYCSNSSQSTPAPTEPPTDPLPPPESSFSDDDLAFIGSDLYLAASAAVDGTIMEWCYDDFDMDGKLEAFVGVGDEDTYFGPEAYKSLWYISDTYEAICIIEQRQYWYLFNVIFSLDDCKLLLINGRHGCHSIWGIKDNTPIETTGVYYYDTFQDANTGVIYGKDKLETLYHILEFDYDEMTFYDTGKTVLR